VLSLFVGIQASCFQATTSPSGPSPVEQIDRHDHHLALAVPALRHLAVDPGLLDGVQGHGCVRGGQVLLLRPERRQPLQRGHLVLDSGPGRDAGARLAAAHQHCARSALTQAAPELGAVQAQLVAQHVQQRRVGG